MKDDLSKEFLLQEVNKYCGETDCENCKLKWKNWVHRLDEFGCLELAKASYGELLRAYTIINRKNERKKDEGTLTLEDLCDLLDAQQIFRKHNRRRAVYGIHPFGIQISPAAFADLFGAIPAAEYATRASVCVTAADDEDVEVFCLIPHDEGPDEEDEDG